jgi:hypothetical protein
MRVAVLEGLVQPNALHEILLLALVILGGKGFFQ